jgi:predicted metal-binding membrane protein
MSSTDGRAYRQSFPLAIAALASCSLLALLAWGASPYGGYLQHDYQPYGAADQAVAFGLFLGGWLLMSVAMMLPTATRLLRDFSLTVRLRPQRRRLQTIVATGFLATWLAVGYVFRSLDTVVHAVMASAGWLEQRTDLLGAGVLVAAGLFQFSSLQHRCLIACRSPRSFIYRHWRGGNPHRDALRVGLSYGASCVGCCWALMLLMFAVGTANLAWMLGLATVMAVEKNMPWGAALARPLGAGLIAGGVASMLI